MNEKNTMMRILGCGSSGGVPQVGSGWGTCDPTHPRNYRLRSSLLITHNDAHILIDITPDTRQQMLSAQVNALTAVILTHTHADHIHGIDDLRWFKNQSSLDDKLKPITVYAEDHTCAVACETFSYIMSSGSTGLKQPQHPPSSFAQPPKTNRTITAQQLYPKRLMCCAVSQQFTIAGLVFQIIPQIHGPGKSMGLRVGNVAYTTDVSRFVDSSPPLYGLDLWIVGCLSERPHPAHANLDQVLQWVEEFQPKRVLLTHMNNSMDYNRLCRYLPARVRPAYDGLCVDIPQDVINAPY